MVQIIEGNDRNFLKSLLGGAAGGASAAAQLMPELRKQQQQQKQQDFLQQLINRGRQPQATGETPAAGTNLKETNANEYTGSATPYSNEDILAADMADPSGHLARDMQAQNTEAATQRREKRKETITFHQESQKQDEEIQNRTRMAKAQQQTIKDIKKAVDSGDIRPLSMANIFRGMGPVGEKIANAFTNKNQSVLNASIPQLLEGWKEVFGIRLSDADLALLENKLPSIGKSKEANAAVLDILKKYSDMTLLRSKIAAKIKKENGGLRPLGFIDKIEEEFDKQTNNEFAETYDVVGPDGKAYTIAAIEVDQLPPGFRLL
jgi:hypothetical protein